MKKLIQGVGYIGEGKYSKYNTKLYLKWETMLTRVYRKGGAKGYEDVIVEERWHNYQNFCEDITKMPNYNIKRFALDKDLILLGNRRYGPDYCSIVPIEFNFAASAFIKNEKMSIEDRIYYIVDLAERYRSGIEDRVYNTLTSIKPIYFELVGLQRKYPESGIFKNNAIN